MKHAKDGQKVSQIKLVWSNLPVPEHAERINGAFRKGIDATLELSEYYAEADKHLKPDQKKELFKLRVFNKSKFSIYAK